MTNEEKIALLLKQFPLTQSDFLSFTRDKQGSTRSWGALKKELEPTLARCADMLPESYQSLYHALCTIETTTTYSTVIALTITHYLPKTEKVNLEAQCYLYYKSVIFPVMVNPLISLSEEETAKFTEIEQRLLTGKSDTLELANVLKTISEKIWSTQRSA